MDRTFEDLRGGLNRRVENTQLETLEGPLQTPDCLNVLGPSGAIQSRRGCDRWLDLGDDYRLYDVLFLSDWAPSTYPDVPPGVILEDPTTPTDPPVIWPEYTYPPTAWPDQPPQPDAWDGEPQNYLDGGSGSGGAAPGEPWEPSGGEAGGEPGQGGGIGEGNTEGPSPLIPTPTPGGPHQLATPSIASSCAQGCSLTPTLDWHAVGSALGYTVVIHAGLGCSGAVVHAATVAPSLTAYTVPGGVLAASTNYSWRVRALGNGTSTLNSDWSDCCDIPRLAPVTLSETLPDGVVDTAYDESITITGGVGPWSAIVDGGELPPGLALSVVGNEVVISGTPTGSGDFSFGVTVTSQTASDCTAQAVYAVSIQPPVPSSCPPGLASTYTLTGGPLTTAYLGACASASTILPRVVAPAFDGILHKISDCNYKGTCGNWDGKYNEDPTLTLDAGNGRWALTVGVGPASGGLVGQVFYKYGGSTPIGVYTSVCPLLGVPSTLTVSA